MASNKIKPDAFFKQLLAIASKFVESHDALTKELVDRNKGVYALRNTVHPIIMDNRPFFYLLQVKNCNGLFIHISVTLKAPYANAALDKNYEFEGVSIQFLCGTNKLFCRAEWDVKKEKEKLEHPQPHWHWGYSEEKEPDRFVASNNINVPFIEAGEEELQKTQNLPAVDFKELHYAMAAKWVANDEIVEDFSPQHLCDWMKRCICSVVDQYNYQVNKAGFVTSRWW